MKRDLKLNMSHLDAISRKVQSYIDAMMRVDRNDIWWNYKQIEGEATSFDWIV